MRAHESPETLLSDSMIRLTDGRVLAFREWGDPAGRPVLFFHGMPDSRHWCPDKYPMVTRRTTDCGVRLITVDRPGCSISTPKPWGTLLGWPDDVAALLDHLGIERIPLIGVSGGGPYAMACAVVMPERLTRLGLVSTVGPPAEMPDSVETWSDEERALMELARTDPQAALSRVQELSQWIIDTPESIADPNEWPEADRWGPLDHETRELMIVETREVSAHHGTDGFVWDRMNVDLLPWGFSPRDVRVETYIWSGAGELTDHFEFLRSAIPGARAKLWTGVGHLALMRDTYWGEVLEPIAA